jgi:HEAT repeat protein
MPGLTSALDDPEPEVRWRAAMALGWLRNSNAISILQARLANEKDETVRENIEASLKRLAALQKNSPGAH